MECLPLEVVEKIASYLSGEDLAACCATSREWRAVFNRDVFWKPRCDHNMAAHLRATESMVEPRFVSPEEEETSLSSICDWRMSYMRENHLWNNWRQKRFIRKEFKHFDKTIGLEFCAFITTMHVILKSFGGRNVSLWNIRLSVYLCDVFSLSDQKVDYCQIFGSSFLVILQRTTLYMFRIPSPIDVPWTLKYTLTLGQCSGSNLGVDVKCFITGFYLVAADWKGSVKIVNLEKGNILTEILWPIPQGLYGHSLDIIQPENKSYEFGIVAGLSKRELNNSLPKSSYLYKMFVYSLKKMNFINFKTEILCTEIGNLSFGCVLYDIYLGVFYSGTLRVYNYQKSDLMKEISVKNYSVFTIFDLSKPVKCLKTSLVIARNSEMVSRMAWSKSSSIKTYSHSLFFRQLFQENITQEEIAVYLINVDFSCSGMFTDVVEMPTNTMLSFW